VGDGAADAAGGAGDNCFLAFQPEIHRSLFPTQSDTRPRENDRAAILDCRTSAGCRPLNYAGPHSANNSRAGTPPDQPQMRLDRSFFAAFGTGRGRRAVLPQPAAAPLRAGLLASRDFRLLWAIGAIVFSVRWLEMI